MSLPAVLSAFRQLVLDGIELPASAREREALIRRSFEGLSEEEVQDLSKMEPARLQVYTSSVFSAEGNILLNAFPLTLAALEQFWPEEWGAYSRRVVAQRVHRFAPWRGIHSTTLGESFLQFLSGECGQVRRQVPWLLEAGQLEQAMLEVRRAPNEGRRPQKPEDLASLSTASVGELLALTVEVPSLLRGVELEHDLLPIRRAVLEGEALRAATERTIRLLCARPHDLGVACVEVPQGVWELLLERRGQACELSELAEAYLASPDAASLGDDEAFRGFYAMFHSLVGAGSCSLGSVC